MPNSIKSFTDATGLNWHYYSGSFWATESFDGNICLLACPANTDGTPDIYLEDMSVNACDVAECEQHHLDFVNSIFTTNFKFQEGSVAESGIGCPTYG